MNPELNDIIALLSNCLDAFTSVLFVAEARGGRLRLRACHTLSKNVIPDASFSPDDGGLIGWVARNRQPVSIDHFDRDINTLPYYRDDENIKSFAAVPLPMDRGVLSVDSKRQYVFTSKEQKLLHGFAKVICNTLDNEQAFQRHSQLRQLLALWHRSDPLPADAEDPVPFFTKLLDQGCRYLRLDGAILALPDGNFLQIVAVAGKVPLSLLQRAKPVDKGIVGWIFRNRKALFVPKVRNRRRLAYLFGPSDGIGELGALIGLPLAWDPHRVGGVIVFFAKRATEWNKEEKAAVTAIVRRATLVLQNFTLKRELALARNLDPVTETCNLDAFDKILCKRIQRCSKVGGTLALAIMSIDGMEQLNTRVALPDLMPLRQSVSRFLLQELRGRQLLGCIEPMRFALLFENASPRAIHARMQELASALHQHLLEQLNGSTGLQPRFAFSIFPHDSSEVSELWIKAFRGLADDLR
ncbi:MAG: GAF domain-containing protein [Deltaproteobacteria bacterium]|nr:GAF domain-containing protein [Deltaproteobacteria bacterium]MBW2070741.1 GAF domain-containing protein [Deltaproteobacteria bacterium]